MKMKSMMNEFNFNYNQHKYRIPLRYKFNVGDALDRAGFTSYKAKTSGILSQDTLKKIKKEDTNISLKAINSLCMILDMQPKDLLVYEETDTEKEQKEKL